MVKLIRKKVVWLLCIIAISIYAVTGLALAEESDIVDSGSCGDGVTYTIQGNMTDGFTLTISGNGEIDDCPWRGTGSTQETYRFRTTLTHVVIGDGITYLPSQAFEGLEGLSEVEIGDGIDTIPDYAFCECLYLREINLNKVETIGSLAFYGCVSLQSITFDYVTEFGDRPFEGCAFTSFYIPAGVTTFAATVVENCPVTSFQCSEQNNALISDNGIVYSRDRKTLYAVPPLMSGSFTVPNTVETIGGSAFYRNKYITSVSVPESVTAMGNTVFANMNSLVSANMQCSCDIPKYCFSGCSSLTTVELGDGVTQILDSAFNGCTKLAFPEISDSVFVIKKNAFPYDISAYLSSGFQDNGDVYAVVDSVNIQFTKEYDAANELLQAINTQRQRLSNKLPTIQMNADMNTIAMERASLMTVFYEGTSKSSPDNPRYPDGTQLKEHYSTYNGYELVYQGSINETVSEVLDGFRKDGTQSKKLDATKSVGIGCVTSGNVRYWIIETTTASYGDTDTCGTGSENDTKEITYAKYLVTNPSIFVDGTIECREGSICEPQVYFGNPKGSHALLTVDSPEYNPIDTGIVARDENGRLHAVGIGKTQVTVNYKRLSCMADYDVIAAFIYEEGTAITAHACTVGTVFGLQFFVPETVALGYEQTYLLVKKPVYEGNTVVSYYQDILTDYVVVDGNGTSGRVYSYNGIAAKEMSSNIQAIFYGVLDEELYEYETDEYSLREYAQAILDGAGVMQVPSYNYTGSMDVLRTMLADMLTYGAETQNYFDYHTGEVATKGAEEAVALYATSGDVLIPQMDVFEAFSGDTGIAFEGFSLSLDNEVSVYVYIDASREPVFEELVIQNGNDSKNVPVSEWEQVGTNRYRVAIDKINASGYRNEYTVFISRDGGTVSSTMHVGVAAYASIVRTRNESELLSLMQAMLRFSDSATEYVSQ